MLNNLCITACFSSHDDFELFLTFNIVLMKVNPGKLWIVFHCMDKKKKKNDNTGLWINSGK